MAKRYNEEGVRIGDDGLPMTKARVHLHNLYNFCFIYMLIAIAAAIACVVLSNFQGQQLTYWELVAYGGNQFHGFETGTLLRIEALYLLFDSVVCLLANMKGMARLYDNAELRPVKRVLKVMAVGSIAYFAVALVVVHVVEPFSLIMAVTALLAMRLTEDAEMERRSLARSA